MKIVILSSALVASVLLFSCKKNETPPCFTAEGVNNCSELFDSIQANMNNPQRLNELQDCYSVGCK